MYRNDFQGNTECECTCGNKHEAYGGKGYTAVNSDSTIANGGILHREYTCRECGKKYIYEER